MNTGWTGGAFGTGERMSLKYTRAMVNAALDGRLSNVEFVTEPAFGLSIPVSCPDVPAELSNPRNAWKDPRAYDAQAVTLAEKFEKNFAKFDAPAGVREAGPVAGRPKTDSPPVGSFRFKSLKESAVVSQVSKSEIWGTRPWWLNSRSLCALARHDYRNAWRDGAPVVEDGHDRAGVGDVIQRIGGQHDQVGTLARTQGSPFGLDPQQFCVVPGGAYDGLHRREAGLYHVFQFPML